MQQSIVLHLIQLFGQDYSLPDGEIGKGYYKLLALEPSTGDKYLLWISSVIAFKSEDELILTMSESNKKWSSMSNLRLGTNTHIHRMEIIAKHPPLPEREKNN
ncbi:MAG TPA: hypothetical protein VK174_09120 [Chitinophagales bacterium]|nr:hypothetical protein [Chitinophagales bacterium]